MLIEIYTDGSCHTQQCVGAWAAILLIGSEKFILSGTEKETTHNRMELLAVIKSIEYIKKNHSGISSVTVVSDSQYVVGLNARKEKLLKQNFNSKSRKEMTNADLVKEFFAFGDMAKFIKIKAHQKKTTEINYNIEADLLVRKLMRGIVL
jgi:ribonuclease HI